MCAIKPRLNYSGLTNIHLLVCFFCSVSIKFPVRLSVWNLELSNQPVKLKTTPAKILSVLNATVYKYNIINLLQSKLRCKRLSLILAKHSIIKLLIIVSGTRQEWMEKSSHFHQHLTTKKAYVRDTSQSMLNILTLFISPFLFKGVW